MENQKIVILEKRFYIHPVFSNYAASKNGEIVNLKRMKPFRGHLNNCGYLIFSINLGEGKVKSYKTHRFIWEAIKGVIPDGFQINHRKEIKTYNRFKNLELMTPKENTNYSIYKKYKKVIAINLETDEEKIFISIKIAGKELGIQRENISSICRKSKNRKKAKSKKDNNLYTFKYNVE